MFFPIYFYPIVVNAGENNLDDIYTMLHHFQDDFIRWSSVFGPCFAVALGGYRYHILQLFDTVSIVFQIHSPYYFILPLSRYDV